jgi:S1/P1 Nuclease
VLERLNELERRYESPRLHRRIIALGRGKRARVSLGPEGQEMVGAIADQLLTANARQQVQQILGFTLQAAAPWPDCVRSVVHTDDGKFGTLSFSYLPSFLHPEYRTPCAPFEASVSRPEQTRMEDYAKRNWVNCTYTPDRAGRCHEAYHFADVAMQRDGYDRRYVGTNDHDVVSAINAAIFVLQDRPAPPPFSIKDKKEALFLLAHFVGDIHQPLHVGAIYLDPNGTPVDPDRDGLDASTETTGGNAINFGVQNLHSYWDDIPQAWGATPDEAMMGEARAVPPTTGPLNGWAASWATDTVMQSHDAFAGLTFSAAVNGRWTAQAGDQAGYGQNAEKIKRMQLAKGGARLAQLLNSIWP